MTPVRWVKYEERAGLAVRRGPHSMTKKVCNWQYCAKCGLVALKNDASRKALKQPCQWTEDD